MAAVNHRVPIGITDLFVELRGDDEGQAAEAVDTLVARADEVWPVLRDEISRATARESDVSQQVLFRLQDVFIALPAPLDVPILAVATSPHPDAAHFLDRLLLQRLDDVAATALRFVASAEEERRRVGVELLYGLLPHTGALRYVTSEEEVVLPAAAEGVLRDALVTGVDDYVIAQLLIRHGWAVDDALPALRDAVVAELNRDASEAPDDWGDGIGYDLGCDLQVVATSFLHAGEAARPHLALFDRMYRGGDAPLRSVLLESIVGIGGDEAMALVEAWADEYRDFAKKLSDLPGYEIGFRVGLDAARGLLTGRDGADLLRELLPATTDSIFAEHRLARFLSHLHGRSPREVESVLREAQTRDEPELARVAQRLLAELKE